MTKTTDKEMVVVDLTRKIHKAPTDHYIHAVAPSVVTKNLVRNVRQPPSNNVVAATYVTVASD